MKNILFLLLLVVSSCRISHLNLNRLENGKKIGYWIECYPSGAIKSLTKYKDGQSDGIFKGYYECGQLKSKGYYKAGKEHGLWYCYTEKGYISRILKCLNGDCGVVKIANTRW